LFVFSQPLIRLFVFFFSCFVLASLGGFKTKPKRQDSVFGPLLIASTSVNLVIGIVFIVSNFVVTVFPNVTDVVDVCLRTGPSYSPLSPETTEKVLSSVKTMSRSSGKTRSGSSVIPMFSVKTKTVSPTQVAVKPQGEAGCTDHNHDSVDQDLVRGPSLVE
jgi:hypothetical protein